MKASIEFQTGSPLPPDSPAYVYRQHHFGGSYEEVALRKIDDEWRDITVTGPRQVGKSSLLFWLRKILREKRNYAVAFVDLMDLRDLAPLEWMRYFCGRLINALGDSLDRDFTLEPPARPIDLRDYLRDLARYVRENRIAILFDEANEIPAEILVSFYSTLRVIVNQRRFESGPLSCYRFVYAGVFEPDELLVGDNSPFNLAVPHWLRDFNINETTILLSLLEQKHDVQVPAEVMTHVYNWCGGQPFLTQLFATMLDRALEVEKPARVLTPAYVDALVPLVESDATVNLNPIRRKTLEWLGDDPDKRVLLHSLLAGESVDDAPPTMLRALKLIGAAGQSMSGRWQVRNRLVAEMLSAELGTSSVQNESISTINFAKKKAALIQEVRKTLLDC